MESSSQLINNVSVSTRHEKKKESSSKRANDDDDDERSPSWADLPGDDLNMIFSRLFNFDCIRFRLTCKAWRFATKIPLAPPNKSCSMDYKYYYSSRSFPWLMFFSKPKSSGILDFFHPVTNETYTMHIPELANSVFRCSKYGWLLMSRGTHSFFFYNPFIPKYSTIHLPRFHERENHPNFISMSFTAPPTSPDCIVFAHIMDCFPIIYTCRLGRGEDRWSTEYNIDYTQRFNPFHCPPIFFKGVFYQIDVKGRLGASDMKELLEDGGNPPRLKHLPKPTEPNIPGDIVSDYNKYIAEVDGEFVSVFVDSIVGYPVHVFKLDWSTMEWVRVKSLGNKTMFISETTGCLLVPVAETTYQNKIYFPKFRNKMGGQHHLTKDKACMFYSLETRKYHAFGCDFSIEGSDETEALPNSVWIEPNVNNTCDGDGVEDNWLNSLASFNLF